MTTRTFGPYRFESSNEEKIFFPDSGITKGDLIDYYSRIASTMVPHLRDRPLTMHRFPDGMGGEEFFQKAVPDYFPEWVGRVRVETTAGPQDQVLCQNAATLAYLAQQGCITPHVWLSRRDRLDRPDQLVMDLDPPDDNFDVVRRAAFRVRELLDELKLESCVKTTGSRGVHVLVPLDRLDHFDAVRSVARRMAKVLAARYPDDLTAEQRKDKRGGRLYLDVGRNAYGQTAVAPYAVRARPGAPVATPVTWDELGRPELHSRTYTVANVFRRLGQRGDPWSEIRRHGRSLAPAGRRLEQMAGRQPG